MFSRKLVVGLSVLCALVLTVVLLALSSTPSATCSPDRTAEAPSVVVAPQVENVALAGPEAAPLAATSARRGPPSRSPCR
jgi:hypothetical protein